MTDSTRLSSRDVATFLLRTLEVLVAKDDDQELVQIYDELKPRLEATIRKRDRQVALFAEAPK